MKTNQRKTMMRLITEQNNDIEVLTEDKDGKSATYIKGIFLQGFISISPIKIDMHSNSQQQVVADWAKNL